MFLAGGIGVTPFLSIVQDAVDRQLPHRIFMFYSNKRPESTAFLNELRNLERQSSRFTLIPTFTEAGTDPQGGFAEHGHISAAMIARQLGGLAMPVFYIAGPPAMVAQMETMLTKAGIHRNDLHAEKFAGY